ncbi:MAG: PD40 domain-containing protein [Planctomycetes bacterium]|nr:PD40 domain-containing protein [Planctomycetota bacterium]
MRNYLFVAACATVLVAGCNWSGQASLVDPQPILPPSSTTMDVLGQLGDSPGARFETEAYSGLQQNSFCEIGADVDPVVSPDGNLMVFCSTRHSRTSDIYVKKVAGRTVTRLTDDLANEVQPALSPDGNFIAYASDRSGNWDIFVVTADGRKPFQVTSGLSHEVHPSWSPDGANLCYSEYNPRSGQWEIWIVEVANPANRRFVAHGLFPAWCPSPSVNRIAYQLARRRGTNLFSVWTIDLIDGEARFPTEVVPATAATAAIAPAWSPDGTRLVYSTVNLVQDPKQDSRQAKRVERGDDIWVTTLDGLTRVKLTVENTNDWCPTWSPDGRIYFASNRGGNDNIWSLQPLDTNLIQATRVSPTRVGNAKKPEPAAAQPSGQPEAKVKANGAAM